MLKPSIRAALVAAVLIGAVRGSEPCPPRGQEMQKAPPAVKMEWRSREVVHEVEKPVWREEIKREEREVQVPDNTVIEQECITYRWEPRQVTRDVVRHVQVPVTVVDPCTGCARTTCKQQSYVEKETTTVYDAIPDVTKIPLKLCQYRTERRVFEYKEIHLEYKKVSEVRVEYYQAPVER